MGFDPNIPQPADFLSNSQGQILTNFQEANAVMGVNHYAFSPAISNKGKHTFLQMPERDLGPNPIPITAVDEIGLYSKVGTNPSETNLFMRAENSGGGGGFEYQLTHVDSAATTEFATNTIYATVPVNFRGGWTFLPGGLILQYGLAIISNTGGNNTVPFPRVFNVGVYSIVTTGFTTTGSTNTTLVNNVTTTNFTIVNTSSGSVLSMYWQAIGL